MNAALTSEPHVVPTCPHCGGRVIVVLRRAWCAKAYANGGCGSHWPRWLSVEEPGERAWCKDW